MSQLSQDLRSSGDSPSAQQQSRLTRFLNDLGLSPNEPPYDVNDNSLGQSGLTRTSSSSPIFPSAGAAAAPALSNINPEADSFIYIENLLESLAVLGQLGSALDSIAQRLPGEIFNLVEGTLDEVEERVDFVKRKSLVSLGGTLPRSEGVYLLVPGSSAPVLPIIGVKNSLPVSSTLRLSALESLSRRVDHETLKDLFWTLYSKFLAVAQSLRVVTEVANRIGSVGHGIFDIHSF